MSLLDDAKRLAGGPNPRDWQGDCELCMELLRDHAPDCPWLALPRIVAALEAAERLAGHRWPEGDEDYSEGIPIDAVRLVPTAEYGALVAALKGEAQPA